jgi:restriction system protein
MDKHSGATHEGTGLTDRLNAGPVLSAAATDDLLALSGLSAKEIERRVADAHRRQGYEVDDLAGPAARADAGLLLRKADKRVLLQCRYWKTRRIIEPQVREFYGMMATHGADAGILVTAGSFTLEASRFAGLGRIQLIDRQRLLAMLRADDTATLAAAQPAQTSRAG